jgi:hypothetical protein
MPTITFNGKTYNSLDEMPAHERQAFEKLSSMFVDANGNGIPDFLEGDMAKNVMTFYSDKTFNFNGQAYTGMEQLPPEVQTQVQHGFEMLSKMGIVAKAPTTMTAQTSDTKIDQTPYYPASKPFVSQEYSPVIQEEKGSNTVFWIALAIGLGLCLIAAVALAAYLFFVK